MKERLLKLAQEFREEAMGYRQMSAGNDGPPELRPEWLGVAKGLERAATILTAEAYGAGAK